MTMTAVYDFIAVTRLDMINEITLGDTFWTQAASYDVLGVSKWYRPPKPPGIDDRFFVGRPEPMLALRELFERFSDVYDEQSACWAEACIYRFFTHIYQPRSNTDALRLGVSERHGLAHFIHNPVNLDKYSLDFLRSIEGSLHIEGQGRSITTPPTPAAAGAAAELVQRNAKLKACASLASRDPRLKKMSERAHQLCMQR
jgi:hypothetical protein